MDGLTIAVIVLSIFCFTVMIVMLVCYFYAFRNLLCPPERRSKKRRRANPRGEFDNANRAVIPLNDIAQEESMPTESDKI
ncbi:hypothetical protein ALC56_06529 [Trachymyrmex septentrionalis]|uniref:Uncharacterized protein n=1 Tax=Trachymyrmex septentrionalis TaxID=34720 RepID=A0A195FFE2_9HYME|nr:hypothetical protein ALC56_06529 [Trachymyrmex septentrionalis]